MSLVIDFSIFAHMYKPLNLPQIDVRLQMQGQNKYIFDSFRKKFVTFTPEEWVRQHVAAYLVSHYNVPRSFISIEYPLKVNRMLKRADIVVFNMDKSPGLVVECKAPEVKITEDIFWQASIYNLRLNANLLMVTNGLEHYFMKVDTNDQRVEFIDNLPVFLEWGLG